MFVLKLSGIQKIFKTKVCSVCIAPNLEENVI